MKCSFYEDETWFWKFEISEYLFTENAKICEKIQLFSDTELVETNSYLKWNSITCFNALKSKSKSVKCMFSDLYSISDN